MKLLPLSLGILIYIHLLVMAFLNRGQEINLSIWGNSPIEMKSQVLFIILTLYAGFATFSICYFYIINLKSKLKKQMRNTEKATIQTEGSADKVKNLQAKIDTLEMALRAALKK